MHKKRDFSPKLLSLALFGAPNFRDHLCCITRAGAILRIGSGDIEAINVLSIFQQFGN